MGEICLTHEWYAILSCGGFPRRFYKTQLMIIRIGGALSWPFFPIDDNQSSFWYSHHISLEFSTYHLLTHGCKERAAYELLDFGAKFFGYHVDSFVQILCWKTFLVLKNCKQRFFVETNFLVVFLIFCFIRKILGYKFFYRIWGLAEFYGME